MMIILNEEKYARDVITGRRTDVKRITQRISLLARYNYHVLHKDDMESYTSIVKWLEKHQDIFSEVSYSNVISKYIKKAKKQPFYNIESIKITKKEMDIIQGHKNVRYEKILFVLLCLAKVQRVSHGFKNNLICYDIPQLFKMARVSVPAGDREYLLHDFLVEGLISLPKKIDSKCMFINFVDEDESDVALEIKEPDCEDLAYCYLYYIKKGNVFRCAKCKKLTKQSKKFGDVCKECRESDNSQRTLWCIECGAELIVGSNDYMTCRCEECNRIYQKQRDVRKHQIWREKMRNQVSPEPQF